MIKKISVIIICLVLFMASSVDGKLCNQKFDFSNYSASNAALRSALLPGWGQGWNEQETKGWIIFGIFIASACMAFHFNNEAEKSYKFYTEIGAPAGTEYDNYKSNFDAARILGTVAVLTWMYAVADAYFVAKKEEKKYVNNKFNLVMHNNDGFKLEYKTKFSI